MASGRQGGSPDYSVPLQLRPLVHRGTAVICLICQDIWAFGGVFGLYLVSEQDADLYLAIIGWTVLTAWTLWVGEHYLR